LAENARTHKFAHKLKNKGKEEEKSNKLQSIISSSFFHSSSDGWSSVFMMKPNSIWLRGRWTSWASRLNVRLLHVPLRFGVPHGQASYTLHAPRTIMLILDGSMSFFMLRGDTEIESSTKSLPTTLSTMMIVSSFRGWCSWPYSSCLATQIHKQLLPGFLTGTKMYKESIWNGKNCNEFSRR
jgi:hypothetical protein